MASELTNFPLSGPISLDVRLGYGSITVTTREDGSEAVVRLSPRGRAIDLLERVDVNLRDGNLLIAGPRAGGLAGLVGGWRRHDDGIDALIEVPAGTEVNIASASEAITVTGRCGPAEIAATGGRISLDTVDGDLRLRCGTAETRVAVVTGSAQLRSSGGAAHFGQIGGSLNCKFGNGDLAADVVHGALLSRAGTASAHLGAVYGNVDMAFGSGSISVGLPAGVSAQVDVMSGTGQVRTDLPVEAAPAPGDRAISVRIRTGSGEIHLQRAAA